MQLFAKFKKIMWSGLRATLNLRKFKVALKLVLETVGSLFKLIFPFTDSTCFWGEILGITEKTLNW